MRRDKDVEHLDLPPDTLLRYIGKKSYGYTDPMPVDYFEVVWHPKGDRHTRSRGYFSPATRGGAADPRFIELSEDWEELF